MEYHIILTGGIIRLNASVYFKTNHNWNTSPTTTHLLTYFHDDESISPERASLSGDVTSSSPLVSRSFSTMLKSSQSEIEAPTINEIGLPLFPLEPKPEVGFYIACKLDPIIIIQSCTACGAECSSSSKSFSTNEKDGGFRKSYPPWSYCRFPPIDINLLRRDLPSGRIFWVAQIL